MSKVDYTFRINKQVERKILIDLLSQLKNELNIAEYTYVGMGAIYFYDFILIHKALGINKQISLENEKPVERFTFNKPYDFIDFIPEISTDYLNNKHEWNDPSIIWLDYETSYVAEDNDFVDSDLRILGKNCKKNTIVFISINASSLPIEGDRRKSFIEKYKKYMSSEFFDIKYTTRKLFIHLIQNIWINILNESCEYNDFKFHKICSFSYADGAEMYTLGGIFTDNEEQFNKIIKLHSCLNNDAKYIQNINTPIMTLKEKYFLNSNIKELEKIINEHEKSLKEKVNVNEKEELQILDELISQKIPFKLTTNDLKNYITNYRYIPSYHEGVV